MITSSTGLRTRMRSLIFCNPNAIFLQLPEFRLRRTKRKVFIVFVYSRRKLARLRRDDFGAKSDFREEPRERYRHLRIPNKSSRGAINGVTQQIQSKSKGLEPLYQTPRWAEASGLSLVSN